MPPDDFDEKLRQLDISLFSAIPTQSLDDDRRSWLAVQRSVRSSGYHYMEIGSYLGGSLQQHLIDPLCLSIVSIDCRPFAAPDDRGKVVEYEQNSTHLMLRKLQKIDANASRKITTFECDASAVNPTQIPAKADFCFIDGEHTKEAVVSDFAFCYENCAPNAAICLHDARIIHRGIIEILHFLNKRDVSFTAGRLPGDTFGIFLRDCKAAIDPFLASSLGNTNDFLRRMRIRHFIKSWVPSRIHERIRKLYPAP